MAPSKKPLFDPAPLTTTTLDHYFAKPGTSNSRSASSQIQKRVNARRLSPQTRQKTNVKHIQPFGTNIIVIDSDDGDEEAPAASTKRKDYAGGISDAGVVDAISRRSHDDASRSGKKTKVESGSNLFDVDTDDLLAFVRDDALHFAEFGKPQLLVPAEDEENVPTFAEDQSSQHASSSHSVDQCSVALPATHPADPDDLQPRFLETQSDSSSVLPTCSTQADPSCVIEIDDEWGTGDDELFQTNGAEIDDILELTDEDEIEEVLKLEDAPPDTSGDNLNQCPFCGIDLTSLSLFVCSHLLRAIIVSPHSLCIRTRNHTLLSAVTRFALQILR